jgi:hypothetical protein
MVRALQKGGTIRKKRHDPRDYESPYFRNLRNAWYHELAMTKTGIDIAAWKIVQAYYAVYCSVSALLRCYYPTLKGGHERSLRLYAQDFVTKDSRRGFLLPPATLYLENGLKGLDSITWEYGKTNHIPNVKMGFEWAKKELYRREINVDIVTLPVYLMALRQWVNYTDAYLFFMLYGKTVRDNLDTSLNNITWLYLVQTEYYLIELFRWDAMELQLTTFVDQLKDKLGTFSPRLEARFEVYRKLLA